LRVVSVYHSIEGSTPIVQVPLLNSDRKVVLHKSDFETLIQLGLNPIWRLQDNKVLECGTRLTVARLVFDAKQGEQVNFLDEDPCNLRQSNLYKTYGGSGSNAREKLETVKRSSRRVKLNQIYETPSYMKEVDKLRISNGSI
jgi:hypothetical protein